MSKIDKESLAVFRNADDLVDYIALHRFEPVNEGLTQSDEFKELPQNIADIVYILDFEMVFNGSGLLDLFGNFKSETILNIISSLQRTNNNGISGILQQASQVVDSHGLTHEQIREEIIKAMEAAEEIETFPELRAELSELEENLYNVMDETDYWENAKALL